MSSDPRPPRLRPGSVRTLVFDLDGTLVDSYGPIAGSLNHAREHYGLPPLEEAEVRLRVGHGLESLIAELVGPDRVAPGVRLFRERYAELYAAGTTALPGAGAALSRLHRAGYRMGVASNKPHRFTRPILESTGIADYFACVLGPSDEIPPKPEPTMIRTCVERLGGSPDGAAYVGDMVLDVESARRAGLAVVLVLGGSSSADELHGTGEIVLPCLAELPAALAPA